MYNIFLFKYYNILRTYQKSQIETKCKIYFTFILFMCNFKLIESRLLFSPSILSPLICYIHYNPLQSLSPIVATRPTFFDKMYFQFLEVLYSLSLILDKLFIFDINLII